ncbi:PilZ domain-containing protein [Leptospira hartskeerlii]|uniref:PilZ domain-containing protein n=2 Tax=Leptospira hartskeerlii TaxID=2023177 RepID=A0A2M9X9K5_9LEPT|nr:PilZ domain-containing protein [Leptospira hartskeerlii]PJZ32536.1 PilZ domain-containing protein [Leptospira hartskeerlii]
MERRRAPRYSSEELCKFEVHANIEDLAFNGFVFDISEVGVGLIGPINDEHKIALGSHLKGYIQSPDRSNRILFEGTIVRKDFITYEDQDYLILGINFSVRIPMPGYITKLAISIDKAFF